MAEHSLGHARESQQALDELSAKHAQEAAYQIALSHKNTHLFVSDPFGPSVAEVAYPSGKPIRSFSSGLAGAFGVATSPDSPY